MQMISQKQRIHTGILSQESGKAFLVDSRGKKHLENEKIWDGYITHWLGSNVNARFLPQRDYETGRNIVLLWPYKEPSNRHFVELYYNERLVKYPFSLMGHLAININGSIYNYSHLMNENEIISEEEYFFRPALGEFAPHPVTGRYDVNDKTRPYYDRFGRNFMRTIHVLHIEGLDTGRFSNYCNTMLQEILNAPDPQRPDHNRDFSLVTRSCVTIIRDGLRHSGFKKIRGIFPRDLFINAAFNFTKLSGSQGMRTGLFRMPQLKVPEAPYSALTIIANPINWLLKRKLPDY
jgi:hypothetical protein